MSKTKELKQLATDVHQLAADVHQYRQELALARYKRGIIQAVKWTACETIRLNR